MRTRNKVMVGTLLLSAVPAVVVGAVAVFSWWQVRQEFRHCCVPPADHEPWMCRHRRCWVPVPAAHGYWKRVGHEAYTRAALAGLDDKYQELVSGG